MACASGIPLVYDVHHHRCLPDGLSVEEATSLAVESWGRVGREPYFHISSPIQGWDGKNPRRHADYIDAADFPQSWMKLTATIDVEAKAKEMAVMKLMRDLGVAPLEAPSRNSSSRESNTLPSPRSASLGVKRPTPHCRPLSSYPRCNFDPAG